jgi:PKD repeat protein
MPTTSTRRRTVLALVLALLTTLGFSVLTPSTAHGATERLLVQVQGFYGDGARAPKSGTIVGAVATATEQGQQAFQFAVLCALPNGSDCPAGVTVHWDYGDGSTAQLVVDDPSQEKQWGSAHVYDTPGSYTVRVTVSNSQAHGSGAIRALVGPRFADFDAAVTDAGPDGDVDKAVNPLAEAVWAVTALGLMGPCNPYYTANSAPLPPGATKLLPEDINRAMFCGAPLNHPVVAGDNPARTAPTNPVGRHKFATQDLPAGRSTMEDCLAYYATCGLPASAFTVNTADPTAACDADCRTVLRVAGVLRTDGSMIYDPTRCADNWRTPAHAASPVDATTTLERGVEAGCATRGDFIRALTRAVDVRNELGFSDHQDHPTFLGHAVNDKDCMPAGATAGTPDPDTLDGVRRGAMLLSTSSLTVDPCHPDAALTKGEAYRLLAALLGVTASPGYQETSPLADLVDLRLGHGPGPQAYPGSAAVLAVLEDGAPLVGSSACPVAPTDTARPACFNPYEALTRTDMARLLAHYVLGDLSDTAKLNATLTPSTDQVRIGGTVQLQVEVSVPPWLRPYTSTWQVRLERDKVTPAGSLTPNDLAFTGCEGTIRDGSLDAGPFTASCTLVLRRADDNAEVPLALFLGGTRVAWTTLRTQVVPPLVLPEVSTSPNLVEDGGPFTSRLAFTSNTGPRVSAVQVSHRPDGPWSDLATDTTGRATVRVTESPGPLDGDVDLAWTLTRDAFTDGPADNVVLYARVCNTAGICSAPYAMSEPITPVADAPAAFTITPATFNGTTVPVTGTCTQYHRGNLGPNMFALAGNDPRDGRESVGEGIVSYTLHAAAGAPGALYYCAQTGQWAQLAVPTPGAGQQVYSEVLLWNPPTTQVTNNTSYTFTVTDEGVGSDGQYTSAPAPIVLNSNAPGAAPVVTSVNITPSSRTGPAWTTDFTVTAHATVSGGGVTLSRYTIDFGDGVTTSTAPVPSTRAGVLTHRYTTPGNYTVRVSATDSKGRTSPVASHTLTVRTNYVGDPAFETGVDHWSATTTGQVTLSPVQTTSSYDPTTGLPAGPDRPGRQAALITRVPQGGVSSSPCLVTHTPPALVNKVKAGTSYTFSLWVRPVIGTRGHQFTLTVEELDDGSVLPNARTQAFTLPASDTTWQQVSVTYPATRDGSELRLTAGLPTHSGTGTNAACFAMDDAALH